MKDLKITKELLSEVLGYEVDAFLGISENEIDYTCCIDKDIGYEDISINIYEFTFKCKEWLIKNNFSYMVYYDDYFKNYKCTILSIIGCEKRETFITNTEIKSTIKACEWILSEVNK